MGLEKEVLGSVVLDFTTTEMCVYTHTYTYLCIGIPKETFRFDDLLKGLIELRKAVIPMFMVYCTRRYSLKSAMEKRCVGWRLGKTRLRLLAVLSQWSHTDSRQCLLLPAVTTCVTNQEAHWILGVQTSFWGSVILSWSATVTDLSYSVFSLSQKSN